MSPPTDPKLSPDEQKVYDRWKKVCEHNFKSLKPSVQFSCVVQKKQLEQDAQLKQQMAIVEAGFQLVRRQIEALMYVTQTVDARQAEATVLLGALMRASGEYDQILQARAAAPIVGEIVLGLATSFLPELKVLGTITKRYASSASWRAITRTAKTSSATSWEQLADEIMTSTKVVDAGKKAEKFAEVIDAASKHMIDAVQHPLEANKKLDEASRERLAAFFAKNQILSGIIRDINRTMTAVGIFEPILFRFILWYDGADLVNRLKQKFINADLDSAATSNPADYDVLEDLILYDMLRLYTKTYFKVKEVKRDQKIDDLPDEWDDDDIEGLDEAQREMIYARFGKVRWKDATRPPVNSYKDLLKYWGGTMVPWPGIRKPTIFGYG